MTDYKIRRGPWGKPWITRDFSPLDWPDEADKPLNGFLYNRPSDISGNLDTKENLSPYHQCQAIVGLMLDSAYGGSLAMQFKALVSEHGLKTWENAKGDVKDLLKQARAKGGEEWKAGIGTGFHRYAHLRDIGAEVILPAKELEPWLDCYDEAIRSRFEVLDDECFIVCDDLENPDTEEDVRAAGNFDRLLLDKQTGEVMIADIKTGASDNEWAMKVHIQLALYAHGVRFDQETGRRWPIHDDLSLTKGIMIHVPLQSDFPCCDIYPVDLTEGWRLAKQSNDITAARKMRVYKKDALVRVK